MSPGKITSGFVGNAGIWLAALLLSIWKALGGKYCYQCYRSYETKTDLPQTCSNYFCKWRNRRIWIGLTQQDRFLSGSSRARVGVYGFKIKSKNATELSGNSNDFERFKLFELQTADTSQFSSYVYHPLFVSAPLPWPRYRYIPSCYGQPLAVDFTHTLTITSFLYFTETDRSPMSSTCDLWTNGSYIVDSTANTFWLRLRMR